MMFILQTSIICQITIILPVSCPVLSFVNNPQLQIQYVTAIAHTKARNTLASTQHTHTPPFNGSLSGTTQVSRYQKGETNLDFTEARDSEWQWH